MKGELKKILGMSIYLILIFNYSENIERYRKIIQQRIVAVSEEANRKYKNLLESIPSRLEQVVKQDDVKNDVATENIE